MVVMRNDYHREQKWKGGPGAAVAGQRRLLSKQKHDVKPGQGLQNHMHIWGTNITENIYTYTIVKV